jgi:hypothetical protein
MLASTKVEPLWTPQPVLNRDWINQRIQKIWRKAAIQVQHLLLVRANGTGRQLPTLSAATDAHHHKSCREVE